MRKIESEVFDLFRPIYIKWIYCMNKMLFVIFIFWFRIKERAWKKSGVYVGVCVFVHFD